MKHLKIYIIIACICVSNVCASAQESRPRRYVAITFDDLPVVCRCEDDADRLDITEKLLQTFKAFRMPVLGVVNEQKLESDGKVDPGKVDLLSKWLERGFELGNHGYAHKNINDISMAEYQKEILDGERITRPLAEKAGVPYRFFRHPYLSAGDNLAVRKELDDFLKKHKYTVAPNTITYQDYTFSGAYEVALQDDDTVLAQKIRDEYLMYTLSRWETAEQQALDLFGRDIRHILMVHANRLNADVFGDVAAMMAARGYAFISMDDALQDPVYSRPDTFDGKVGVTWLSRWAAEMGRERKYSAAPVPQFIIEIVTRK